MTESEITILRIIAAILFVSCWIYVGMTYGMLGVVFGWFPAWGVAFGLMAGVSIIDGIFK